MKRVHRSPLRKLNAEGGRAGSLDHGRRTFIVGGTTITKTDAAILGMLTFAPMSGYDMKKFSEQSLAHFWHESYGNLYPRLRKLEAAGLVRKRRERRDNAPDAIVYRITAAGRRRFRAWMHEDPEPEQVRSDFMLKIFFGVEAGLDRCAALIRDYRAEQEAKRDAYAGIEQMICEGLADHPDAFYWLMSLRRGQLLTDARLAWCHECEILLLRASSSHGTPPPTSLRNVDDNQHGVVEYE